MRPDSKLVAQQNRATGAWAYRRLQDAVEPTCLATLALRDAERGRVLLACRWLEGQQNPGGFWNAFAGDDADGCWTTSLAVITLVTTRPASPGLLRAVRWLMNARGREAGWLWRWKFETVDTKVRFDPRKYGWSWVEGTTSWVIPTALAMVALQKAARAGLCRWEEIKARLELGCEMLLDRMSPGGGWNAGNRIVFGVPLAPHIDATAIALLGLQHLRAEAPVEQSLASLGPAALQCPSLFSVAWALLAACAHRRPCAALMKHFGRLLDTRAGMGDVCAVALAVLAMEAAAGGENVFEVKP